jgi:predicted nucleic acid-binding protein
MVLVDTPVWSLALRRRKVDLAPKEMLLTQALYELVREGRVQLLGATRQEVLSGIREETQFLKIRNGLRAFEDVPLGVEDYERAAEMSNQCRRNGVAGSSIDMLICAASLRHKSAIFSTDLDFAHYVKVIPIELFMPSASAG